MAVRIIVEALRGVGRRCAPRARWPTIGFLLLSRYMGLRLLVCQSSRPCRNATRSAVDSEYRGRTAAQGIDSPLTDDGNVCFWVCLCSGAVLRLLPGVGSCIRHKICCVQTGTLTFTKRSIAENPTIRHVKQRESLPARRTLW